MRALAVGIMLAIALAASVPDAEAQYAELSGRVLDESGAVIAKAAVSVVSKAKGLKRETETNDRGLYVLPALQPDEYVVRVQASGFQTASRDEVVLEVEQRAQLDFTLKIGEQVAEVTVVAETNNLLGSTDGSVSTVIDRRFAADLPVNGRTFGTLLALAPGVTPVITNVDGGQYSVNGQRSASNYLLVDGVAANVGIGTPRDGIAGQRPSATITGGLNGLVSMDALQEIHVQTSSFAPEFGRSPGGQISVVTRSGSNTLQGSAFEQFRDQALAANNWFLNSRGIKKADLDQHQFGATIGGPIIPNRTFYFGSFEGLRLLQPLAVSTGVPSIEARQLERPVQQLYQSYPTPTGPDRADGSAEFITSGSVRTNTNTFGLRVDQAFGNGTQMFARYSHAPSSSRDDRILYERAVRARATSITGGLTSALGPNTLVDVRLTYGEDVFRDKYTAASQQLRQFFPGPVSSSSTVIFQAGNLSGILDGTIAVNSAAQFNVMGSVSHLVSAHLLKIGVDFRRVSPELRSPEESVSVTLLNARQGLDGLAASVTVDKRFPLRGYIDSFSFYLQDAWKASGRLSVSYGFRWDINPAPDFPSGEGPLAASVGGSLTDVGSLTLLPTRNVPLWKTRFNDIVPRVGFSYAVDADARLTLSGGLGLFGDLSAQAAGIVFQPSTVPNGTSVRRTNVPLPLAASAVQGLDTPSLTPPFTPQAAVIDPDLRMPRTTQWNITLERAIGGSQSVSVAYVGASGWRLLRSKVYTNVGPNFPGSAFVTSATGRSSYQALQLEYRRRAARGLQVLTSYTLGEARDTASANFAVATEDQMDPASFDVRHVFNTAASWTLPSPERGPLSWALGGWGLHAVGTARSGSPFTVQGTSGLLPTELVQGRASLVPGVSIILEDGSAPGGQRYNRAAFTSPAPGTHGDTRRNQFRGLATYQLDLGLQRTFPLNQAARVQLRVDAFNVLNNPSFGLPFATITDARFGVPTQTLNEAGGFNVNSLYRGGGPRVVELALRFQF